MATSEPIKWLEGVERHRSDPGSRDVGLAKLWHPALAGVEECVEKRFLLKVILGPTSRRRGDDMQVEMLKWVSSQGPEEPRRGFVETDLPLGLLRPRLEGNPGVRKPWRAL